MCRYFVRFQLLLFLFLGTSFVNEDKTELLYRHYLTALRNKENFQNFLVVRIVDLNNNEVREFCTLGCFLRNALHKEWNLDFDKLSDDLVTAKASMNHPRLFEFRNTEAIQYLGLDLYSVDELNQLQKEVDFKKLAKEITASKKWEKPFGENDKLLRMYAHSLFNQGILTGEDITSSEGILSTSAR